VTVPELLTDLRATEWSRLVGRLIRITGDWSLAEDCVQDAFLRAWELWPQDGVPLQPAAWLAVTARHRALDLWRRNRMWQEKVKLLKTEDEVPDDRLALIFTCCHPSLPLEGQVALTLRAVSGLSTAEVARAFLVSEATMTRRLTRAKTKLQDTGVSLVVPPDPWRVDRLAGVLGVLYLLFNRGNDAGSDDPDTFTLAPEAVRLTRLLVELLPGEAEPQGALALMLFTLSRRPARFAPDWTLISLEFQDRALWNTGQMAEATQLLQDAWLRGDPGRYTLQAAIAGCHARASRVQDTDFRQIAGLYTQLEAVASSPVVRLNLAVARGLADGPQVGLALLDPLCAEPLLANYHLLPAARADFLGKLGLVDEAEEAYARAEALAPTPAEREYLARKRRRLG
jgi:RNA polymerase sigma-70 factor (ECF subfamily)